MSPNISADDYLPSEQTISDALGFFPEEKELIELWDWLTAWKVWDPVDLHDVPKNAGRILTFNEIVEKRVKWFRKILQNGDGTWTPINLSGLTRENLQDRIEELAPVILRGLHTIAPIWTYICNSRSYLAVDENGDAHFMDMPERNFREPDCFDFSVLHWGQDTDWGARLKDGRLIGELVGTVKKDVLADLNKSGGGNKGLLNLRNHPLVDAMFPNKELKSEYIRIAYVLGILHPIDMWSQSIWVPHSMPPGHARWNWAGQKSNLFYHQNFKTKGWYNVISERD